MAMGFIGNRAAGDYCALFLKLKRQPLEVPSTYLWKRSIEDMHVNSLWQRLRQNLLLFLQLLLIALAMLALLGRVGRVRSSRATGSSSWSIIRPACRPPTWRTPRIGSTKRRNW